LLKLLIQINKFQINQNPFIIAESYLYKDEDIIRYKKILFFLY
jgi:hypothetical protein